MHRFLLPLFLVALLVGCSPAPATPESGAKKPATGTVAVAWKFEQTREGEYGEPYSNVAVRLSGDLNQVIIVGEFSGSCAEQRPEDIGAAAEGVVAAARCWWAGAGEDFRVRRTAEALRVEHRSVDEGTAEEPAPVFPFKLIGDELAIDASLTVR